MMGRLDRDQGQLFYSFSLDDAVPDDHPVREIAAVLDLSWVHAELAPYYPPSFDRSSADDPNADRRLLVRDPLGAGTMPGCASEPRLSVVLRAVD